MESEISFLDSRAGLSSDCNGCKSLLTFYFSQMHDVEVKSLALVFEFYHPTFQSHYNGYGDKVYYMNHNIKLPDSYYLASLRSTFFRRSTTNFSSDLPLPPILFSSNRLSVI